MAQFTGGDEMILNTSTWPDGIYLARLADSNESAVIRLVKQT